MPGRPFARQLGALLESGAAGPAIGAGMRAATATVLPLILGELTGQPAFLTMALGGYLASLADPGGSYRSRAKHLIAFLLGGAAVCLAGGLAAGHPLLVLPLLFAGAFLCGMARALGDSAGTVGGLVLLLFAVIVGTPSTSGGGALHAVLLRTGLFAAGALIAMALSLSLWPFHPYRPVRFAVAASYRALAAYARELLHLSGAEELAWDALGRRQRARIRDGLERTRRVLLAARGQRQGETARGELLLALHETADLLLGVLSAMGEPMRLAAHGNIEDEERALTLFAAALDSVAESVSGGSAPLERRS
ncbi:MAG TPA: FUSC family membrane protein, partial [Myxococcales bacterium]|nr:FUSC family membrane protein [Myxococcales bacterium]